MISGSALTFDEVEFDESRIESRASDEDGRDKPIDEYSVDFGEYD
jgi:hypothetical protein